MNNKSFDSTQDLRPAGFWLRLLASILEFAVETAPTTLFALFVTNSSSLNELIFRVVLYLAVWMIPFMFLGTTVYLPWFTTRFGGPLGKIMTGLQITDEKGKPLDYKRAFFRHNIAYAFSGLLFGWGFLSIARDSQKQGWHDKATGSLVWKKSNLWPVSLMLLTVLTGFQIYLWKQAVTNFVKNPVFKQAGELFAPQTLPTPMPLLDNTSPKTLQ